MSGAKQEESSVAMHIIIDCDRPTMLPSSYLVVERVEQGQEYCKPSINDERALALRSPINKWS